MLTGGGIVVPYLGIAAIVCLSNVIAKCRRIKWLMIVSSSSYIIYLFHTTFEGFTKSIIHKIIPEGDMWFTVGAIVVVATGVILPIVIHRYVLTKFYITKLLFGLKQ